MKKAFLILAVLLLFISMELIPAGKIAALTITPPLSYTKQIIWGGQGGYYIAVKDTKPSPIVIEHLDSSGKSLWDEPSNIGAHPSSIAVANDANGGLFIVWDEDYENSMAKPQYFQVLRAQRIDNTGKQLWYIPGIIISNQEKNNDSRLLRELYMVPDKAGGFIVVWKSAGALDGIFVQRINDTGQTVWAPEGIQIATHPIIAEKIACVPDGEGGVIVIWNGNSKILAQRVDKKGNLLWGNEGISLNNYYNDLEAVPDVNGGVVVVIKSLGGFTAMHIRTDGKIEWTSNIPNNDQYWIIKESQTVISNNGGVLIVWKSVYGTGEANIYANYLDNTGALLWGAKPIMVSSYVSTQSVPQIISNNTEGLMVAWEYFHNDKSYIFMQRLDESGKPKWGQNGSNILRLYYPARDFLIAPNSNGALLVTEEGGWESRGLYTHTVSANKAVKHAKTSFYPVGLPRVKGDSRDMPYMHYFPPWWLFLIPAGIVIIGGAFFLTFFGPRRIWGMISKRRRYIIKGDIS
jgi:hypothetical protein